MKRFEEENISNGLPGTRPATPSFRARLLNPMVRLVVKHWNQGDPPAVVRRARRVFGYGGFLDFLHTRGLTLESVNQDGIRGEWVCARPEANLNNVVLYLHGGGYVSCSPRTHRPVTT